MNRAVAFGPWATMLDTSAQSRLTTFWKRRMAMLPCAAASWASRPGGGFIPLLAFALAILAVPTIQLSRAPAAAPEPAKKPAAPAPKSDDAPRPTAKQPRAAGQPVRVEFPGGGVAELVAIGEHPSQNKPWWAPDGQLTAPPYQQFRSTVQSDNEIIREIAVRWIEQPPQGVVAYWNPLHAGSSAGGAPRDANGKPIDSLETRAVAFPAKTKICAIEFSIATEDWKTVAETDGEGYRSEGNPQGSFAYTPGLETDGGLVITISHNQLQQDVRIVAIDYEGKIHRGNCSGCGAGPFMQTTCTFAKLVMNDVKTFALQTRKFEKYEIRDVSLWPGEATEPKVVNPAAPADGAEGVRRPQMRLENVGDLSAATRRLHRKLWNLVDGDHETGR